MQLALHGLGHLGGCWRCARDGWGRGALLLAVRELLNPGTSPPNPSLGSSSSQTVPAEMKVTAHCLHTTGLLSALRRLTVGCAARGKQLIRKLGEATQEGGSTHSLTHSPRGERAVDGAGEVMQAAPALVPEHCDRLPIHASHDLITNIDY